ncbi:hypothetical protein BJ085DRAFT_39183 [Dimargaris cristalligena]|uniref:Myb-like domain-containing protein n=1 Tax=Dimargaris cristalligena TaxID=215637 RepID=A0A4P9ZJN4_9FUNG|nr:hypothetical protein BJ085DRAFT_39183 [Dimargaris cristalligena]|eukprot:RKP33248.1 hypothetical protein BJ085DRAFT_39183 [Dimargaris cristalligena]
MSFTSLRIDKGQTRFAPKVKARPTRRPAAETPSTAAPGPAPTGSEAAAPLPDATAESQSNPVVPPSTEPTAPPPIALTLPTSAPPQPQPSTTTAVASSDPPAPSSKISGGGGVGVIQAPTSVRTISAPSRQRTVMSSSSYSVGGAASTSGINHDPSSTDNISPSASSLATAAGRVLAASLRRATANPAEPRAKRTRTTGGNGRSRLKKDLKTWEEYLAEHEEMTADLDMTDTAMRDFCRNNGRGLPMKSTVERLWEEKRRKDATAVENAGDATATTAEATDKKPLGLMAGTGSTQTPPAKLTPVKDDANKDDDDDGGHADSKAKLEAADSDRVFAVNRNAAQVRVVDGRIVLNEESLVVDRNALNQDGDPEAAALAATLEVVDDSNDRRIINQNTYARIKYVRSLPWTQEETVRFYELLARFGTDFNLVSAALVTRTRKQVLNKFRREESQRPWLVTRALLNRPVEGSEVANLKLASSGAAKAETQGEGKGEGDNPEKGTALSSGPSGEEVVGESKGGVLAKPGREEEVIVEDLDDISSVKISLSQLEAVAPVSKNPRATRRKQGRNDVEVVGIL